LALRDLRSGSVGACQRPGLAVFMSTTPKLIATINPRAHAGALDGRRAIETWLQGSLAEALALARPYPADAMRIVQAGLEMEDLLAA
jgi:putative SOS response-associated peptidase YedK